MVDQMMGAKMKTIHALLQGGLGNQCFIYSTARTLALRHDAQLEFDGDLLLEDRIYKRKLALSSFNCPVTLRQSCAKTVRLAKVLRSRLLRNYVGRIGNYCIDKYPFCYRSLPVDWHGTLTLDGYWQSEKYFYDARECLLNDFKLRDDAWLKSDPVARQIFEAGSSSAFIHVRSYKEVPGREDGSCAKAMVGYYQRAIQHLQERTVGLKLFLFSDDPVFARNLLGEGKTGRTALVCSTDVSDSPVSGQIRDFSLMRLCCHGIIADSSYSWWAGWLGEQEWLMKGEKPIRIRVNRRVMNDDFWPTRWEAVL